MRAFLEAHPVLSVSIIVLAAAASFLLLLWLDTNEARHEMQDSEPKGGI
jgi:hypothetical protein